MTYSSSATRWPFGTRPVLTDNHAVRAGIASVVCFGLAFLLAGVLGADDWSSVGCRHSGTDSSSRPSYSQSSRSSGWLSNRSALASISWRGSGRHHPRCGCVVRLVDPEPPCRDQLRGHLGKGQTLADAMPGLELPLLRSHGKLAGSGSSDAEATGPVCCDLLAARSVGEALSADDLGTETHTPAGRSSRTYQVPRDPPRVRAPQSALGARTLPVCGHLLIPGLRSG